MKHDDAPKSAVGVMLDDIEAHHHSGTALADGVPRVASDSIELVGTARLDYSSSARRAALSVSFHAAK